MFKLRYCRWAGELRYFRIC